MTTISKTHRQNKRKSRPTLCSIQARAAVESVAVPICGRNLKFPLKPHLAADIRALWRSRLAELRAAGWQPVKSHTAYRICYACPFGLFGLSDHARQSDPKVCDRLCCPGRRSALLCDDLFGICQANPNDPWWLYVYRVEVPLDAIAKEVQTDYAHPEGSGLIWHKAINPLGPVYRPNPHYTGYHDPYVKTPTPPHLPRSMVQVTHTYLVSDPDRKLEGGRRVSLTGRLEIGLFRGRLSSVVLGHERTEALSQ